MHHGTRHPSSPAFTLSFGLLDALGHQLCKLVELTLGAVGLLKGLDVLEQGCHPLIFSPRQLLQDQAHAISHKILSSLKRLTHTMHVPQSNQKQVKSTVIPSCSCHSKANCAASQLKTCCHSLHHSLQGWRKWERLPCQLCQMAQRFIPIMEFRASPGSIGVNVGFANIAATP